MSEINAVLLSHQIAAQKNMSVLAGSLSEKLRAGGREINVQFSDVMKKSQTGYTHFPKEETLYRNHATGPITPTDNPLDVALNGKGYFKILAGEEICYQRGGAFRLNAQREIVNDKNHLVLKDDNTPFEMPDGALVKDLMIAGDGTLSIGQNIMGKLGVDYFQDDNKMNYRQDGYLQTDQVPQDIKDPEGRLKVTIEQYALESSNTDLTQFLVKMMENARNFKANQSAIDQENKRLSSFIDQVTRPAGG